MPAAAKPAARVPAAQKLMSAIASLPVKVDSAGRATDSWQVPHSPPAGE